MHDEPRSSMFFRQYYLECLSHASYLIGDTRTGRAVVVDPQRDVDGYLADAAEHGLTIVQVLETHFHADFLSGHLELAAADRGDDRLRTGRGGPGRVPDRHVRRRRPDPARRRRARRDVGDPRDPGPHPGVDQHRRPRRARRPLRRPHRRHPVHRRRRTPGPAGIGRGHRRRPRPPALPLAARPAAHASPTRRRCSPPTGPARPAGSNCRPRPCRRSASSGRRTTRSPR